MAHEIEPVPNVVPEWNTGDVPAWYTAPVPTDRPDWMELRPPYNPSSDLERYWSNVLTPFRALAIGFLWITIAWWRTAILLGVILLLVTLLTAL